MVDVAGELQQELRGQLAQPESRVAVSSLMPLGDNGNSDGGSMDVITRVGRAASLPQETT